MRYSSISVRIYVTKKLVMPILDAAKKALRSSERKRVFNDRRRRVMKEQVKNIRNLVIDNKKEDAQKALSTAYKAIDKAAKKGVIKKNAASRKKSRLAKAIKKIA